ncbi:MAG: thiamine phosphate synthase [Planctomycetota bacterium]|jgi:thiamine-phosphate pyrophosphorylase
MSEHSLTAGAQRAITRAEELVRAWAHAELLPAHLLWALLLDESEAFELLTSAGLTLDELKLSDIWNGQYPAELEGTATAEIESDPPVAGGDLHGEQDDDVARALADAVTAALSEAVGECSRPKESPEWQRVLLSARGSAARSSNPSEVSTTHLLTSLIDEPTSVAELLDRFEIQGALNSHTPSDAGTVATPVAVSFEIDWNADRVDRTATWRILDASANRLREGLRVVEDYVRFILDDTHLSCLIKNCRHRLRAILEPLSQHELIASRDTRGDVGTTIQTAAEGTRGTPRSVAVASLKRAQEAARTLEEYSKLLDHSPGIDASLSLQLESLRYDLYTLEKAVLTTAASQHTLAERRLYLLLTTGLCRGDYETTLREAISGGVGIVQIREKELPDRDLIALARRVRDITRETDTLLVINDRPDLAVLCDADGVHVGQEELSVRDVRRVIGPDRLVGVSTHSIDQARQAVLDGADYLGVGPVFPSHTKSFTDFAGLDFVRSVADDIALPWYAIGGITASNLPQVVAAGARRAAVCGAILTAESPRATSGYLADELRIASSSIPKET